MYVVPVTVRYEPVAEEDAPTLWPPACAGRGVTFVLFQKHTESPYAVRATRTVTGAARCTASGEWIPAMAWTAEMERAFLDLRAATPVAASRRFQRRFVVSAAVALAVAVPLIGGMLWVGTRPNGYERAQTRIAAVAAAPSVGDAVQAPDPAAPPGTLALRWYVVRSVAPAAVAVQAAAATSEDAYAEPDLDPGDFTGPTLRIPRAAFLLDGFLGAPGAPAVVTNAFDADA